LGGGTCLAGEIRTHGDPSIARGGTQVPLATSPIDQPLAQQSFPPETYFLTQKGAAFAFVGAEGAAEGKPEIASTTALNPLTLL